MRGLVGTPAADPDVLTGASRPPASTLGHHCRTELRFALAGFEHGSGAARGKRSGAG
jgi:hypothetical protein